jgi:chloramphenicol-sensitive protein RarD
MAASIDTGGDQGRSAAADARSGLAAGLVANLLWGVLPILFYLVEQVDAVEVVAARTLCALVVVGGLMGAAGRLGAAWAVLADRRTLVRLLLSTLLLGANWLIYVYAVQSRHVLESSFGYFINPMVNVATGMLLLGDRQRPLQSAALGLALVAIAIQAVGLGHIPYIALGLALTFGTYGYLRKTVRANATTGLLVETALLAPLALAYFGWSFARNGIGPLADPGVVGLLLLSGPATAAPLLFFAYAVQRLRLTTVGMLQYLSPSIQFVLAITFFGEALDGVRLVSFVLVWVSLAIFTADGFRGRRQARVRGPA